MTNSLATPLYEVLKMIMTLLARENLMKVRLANIQSQSVTSIELQVRLLLRTWMQVNVSIRKAVGVAASAYSNRSRL